MILLKGGKRKRGLLVQEGKKGIGQRVANRTKELAGAASLHRKGRAQTFKKNDMLEQRTQVLDHANRSWGNNMIIERAHLAKRSPRKEAAPMTPPRSFSKKTKKAAEAQALMRTCPMRKKEEDARGKRTLPRESWHLYWQQRALN